MKFLCHNTEQSPKYLHIIADTVSSLENIPVCSGAGVQAEFVGDFSNVHGITKILLFAIMKRAVKGVDADEPADTSESTPRSSVICSEARKEVVQCSIAVS